MASFTSLNTYSAEDINYSIPTQYVYQPEGAKIEAPMLTWYPVHDLGNTAGNNVVVTHDLRTIANIVPVTVSLDNLNGNPNISITNVGNVVTITGMRDVEDWLNAQAFIDFPTNYTNESGNLIYRTTIQNITANAYPFVYDVVIKLRDYPEWNTPLADFVYDFYGNTQSQVDGIITAFDYDTQTAYILDRENPNTTVYTMTVTTQDHPARFTLSSTAAANVSATFNYANASSNYGQLTVTGTRQNINQYLTGLRVTKSSGTYEGNHPIQRTINSIQCYDYIQNGPGTLVPNIQNQAVIPSSNPTSYSPFGNYCAVFNNLPEAMVYQYNPNGNYFYTTTTSTVVHGGNNTTYGAISSNASNWSFLESNSNAANWTEESWIYNSTTDRNCFIHYGPRGTWALFNNKLWYAPGLNYLSLLPNECGTTTPTTSYPRRIESTAALPANTWVHVAIVRASGVIRMYVNGQQTGTYYSSGMTTTTAAATTAWTVDNTGPWTWGGHTYLYGRTINANLRYLYRRSGWTGRFTDNRISSIVRYTGNFTPPTQPFYNDERTLVLANFRGGTVIDDYQLGTLVPTRSFMTWRLAWPEPNVSVTQTQAYYPQFDDPVWTTTDINYEQDTFLWSHRLSYIGRDISNNPMFCYGFRGDSNDLVIRVHKIDAVTGNLMIGPRTSFGGNLQSGRVQVISDYEGARINLNDGLMTSNCSVLGSGLSGTITIDRYTGYVTANSFPSTTVFGNSVSTFNQQSGGYFYPLAVANGSNVTVNSGGTIRSNSRITTQVVAAGTRSNLGHHMIFGIETDPPNTTFGPRLFNLNPALPNTTAWTSYLPFVTPGNPSGAGELTYRSTRLITLDNEVDNLGVMVCYYLIMCIGIGGGNLEYLYLQPFKWRNGVVTMGTAQRFPTFPGSPTPNTFNWRSTFWNITPGHNKSRAYIWYSTYNSGAGLGLYYRAIDINASQVMTIGAVNEVESPTSGKSFGADIAIQSTSIGAYTYFHAVIPVSGASTRTVPPYLLSYRIPY